MSGLQQSSLTPFQKVFRQRNITIYLQTTYMRFANILVYDQENWHYD